MQKNQKIKPGPILPDLIGTGRASAHEYSGILYWN